MRSIAAPTFLWASTTTSSGHAGVLADLEADHLVDASGAGARRSMNPYWIIQLSS